MSSRPMTNVNAARPNAAWYAIQVAPQAELEVTQQLDRITKVAGQPFKVAPSARRINTIFKANSPYLGLLLWHIELTDELRAEVEALPFVYGFVLEPETYLIEFEPEGDVAGKGQHVDEAINALHRIGRSEPLERGFAPFVLSDAKRLSGSRAIEFLDNYYLDVMGAPVRRDVSFIEVKMRLNAHNRQLIKELPGVVDLVGGDAPVVKRGQRLSRDAELKPITVKPEVALAFSRMIYQVYVLHVNSKFQDRVAHHLLSHRAEQELALFSGAPASLLINGVRALSAQQHAQGASAPAFKGYLYVSMMMDANSWHLVKSTPHVNSFIGGQSLDKVRPVTAKEIQKLGFAHRKEQVVQEVVAEPEALYKSGDLILITDGPFASYVGEVQEVKSDCEELKVKIYPNVNAESARQARTRFVTEFTFPAEVAFHQVKLFED
jgi:transcription termination/antitermination protein NusG